MKLTNSQQRKLHRKLRANASAENVFVHMLLTDLKRAIGKRIEKAQSYEEVDEIIDSINVKKLKKYIKNLSNNVLKRNNKGFEHVIEALTSGVNQLKEQKKTEKKFAIAVPKLIKEKRIYEPLMTKFENNMSKIKDLPKEVYKELKKGYLQGKSFRGSEVEKLIYERMGSRANLIVRTESAKVNTALTEVRARSVGVQAYIWSTSEDQRVRSTHKILNNVLFFWGDEPTFMYKAKTGKISEMSGHAGETPNCRCVALPVFDLYDIQFPVRVAEHVTVMNEWAGKDKYTSYVSSGRIITYTKQQFLNKYGQMFVETDDTKYIR